MRVAREYEFMNAGCWIRTARSSLVNQLETSNNRVFL
jgi:hypothetical protein